MLLSQPYFMTNKDWYYQKQVGKFKCETYLTELGKSIPEVVKSFEEYYSKYCHPGSYIGEDMAKELEKELRAKYKKQGLSDKEIDVKIKEWYSSLNII